MIQLLALILLTILSTYLAGWIAERRGRSVKAWLWLGALFGPLALAAVALLPALGRKQDSLTC
jgi:MFS family permease